MLKLIGEASRGADFDGMTPWSYGGGYYGRKKVSLATKWDTLQPYFLILHQNWSADWRDKAIKAARQIWEKKYNQIISPQLERFSDTFASVK